MTTATLFTDLNSIDRAASVGRVQADLRQQVLDFGEQAQALHEGSFALLLKHALPLRRVLLPDALIQLHCPLRQARPQPGQAAELSFLLHVVHQHSRSSHRAAHNLNRKACVHLARLSSNAHVALVLSHIPYSDYLNAIS